MNCRSGFGLPAYRQAGTRNPPENWNDPATQSLIRFLHETFDCGDVPGGRVRRKRFQEDFTILHALDTVIEDGEHAAVGARADESAKALLQRQDRLRHLIFREGVAAILL